MNNLVTMNYRGTEICGFQSNGKVFIAIKPIVEAMGLAWGSQYNRLKRDPILSKGIFKMKMPSLGAGGSQEHICLSLNRVNGWLFTISSNQIKNPAVRERVQMYQEECYEVLYEYFSGQKEKLLKAENEAINVSLQMVRLSNRIWGARAAAEMWDARGLQRVDAMKNVFIQHTLFDLPAIRAA